MWPFRKSKPKSFSFTCADCGEVHIGSPSFSHRAPIYYLDASDENRIELNDDFCVAQSADDPEQKHFFIRTILEIPIHDTDEPFTLGLWVSQSEDNFHKYSETFGTDQSAVTTFGWLTVNIPHYKARSDGKYLDSLKCDVVWGIKGKRPKLILHECDHELYTDQAAGISWDKAIMLATLMMHGS